MSSEGPQLLRRPLPPERVPHLVKSLPSPRIHAGKRPAPVSDSRRLEAPPTGAMPASTAVGGFPLRPARTLPRIPLLQIIRTDPRFLPPPPSFCLRGAVMGSVRSPGGFRP
ncbi:unnamed protein product [Arctogadus glacialis]